ncbi:microcystin degradation protein MlrC [Catellatospora methionotrophica]|uniref:Microcystin degradation protein MlrC n=1 Tax=Catellatospora methionotrophica TaxID=121620 RepID=A0A8J3PC53_9ACTN|nr:M81 family metallopeptidase [Catellatospora methionotrophica]GIG12076.1 microcystin degradation protein MlrC [Catellatospora methionotrophica]
MSRPLRIAIGGVHIESSTFSPHLSTAADFEVTRGDALLARYDWLTLPWAEGVEWIPLVHARALPGGAVEAAAYEAWAAEIVDRIAASGPLDGMLLDFHGAMSVVGRDDAEGDLITAIRSALGPRPYVSAAMDLHGNVSQVLFDGCDLLTCYRTAPHVDVWETRERAARNLVEALHRGQRPHKALVHVPILLPGEKTSTREEPARGLYARIPEIEARDGVVDAAIWIGYAWADQARCQGAVVVTGTDATAAADAARELGERFWAARDEFAFVAPTGTMDECLDTALAADPARRPFFISDSGDNPGAGGADDVTFALERLLARPEIRDGACRAVFASLVDPQAVAQVAGQPVGSAVRVTAGGRIDAREPGPLVLDGVLEAVADDPDGGRCVSVRVGGLSVFLTSRRMQYRLLASYARLGVEVDAVDVVVVKIGYLEPELFDAAGDWLLALTPGGVDQDLARLPYRRVVRPMFPLDRDFTPELTVVLG